VSVRHSFPKEPTPAFKSFDFEHENRVSSALLQSGPRVLEYLKNQHGASFFNRLSDFHLLLFIQKFLDPVRQRLTNRRSLPPLTPLQTLFQTILGAVVNPSSAIETQIRPKLEGTFAAGAGTSSGASASSASSATRSGASAGTAANGAKPTPPPATVDPRHQEMTQALLLMGFTEQQAKEALQVTNYTSVEHAANYLLSQL